MLPMATPEPLASLPLEATLARLKVIDKEKYEAIKIIAEDALRQACRRPLRRPTD